LSIKLKKTKVQWGIKRKQYF